MELKLYNTLTRDKQEFQPADAQNVRMYGCGPTVYNCAHVGNARAAVVMDLLYRVLRHRYGASCVKFVRNITDVDDKIMEAARTSGRSIDEITRSYEKIYNDDMAALGCLPPDVQPRCTEHIPQMISMIGRLLEKGHAYQSHDDGRNAGHVLFHVPSMPGYGALSRKNRDELIAGARVEVAPYKKDPADFVLWKPSAPDQPGWESPWGYGRPGWHIECSAMSEQHLGETFDIHCGGLDLIFPHHENEIAQSMCAHGGKPMANYWVHNGFLNMGDEKMSKSLGNVVFVHDLLKKWPGEVIRLALLSAHYRQPLTFGEHELQVAKDDLDAWYRLLRSGHRTTGSRTDDRTPAERLASLRAHSDSFAAALYDDLNFPKARADLYAIDDFCTDPDDAVHQEAVALLRRAGNLAGLLNTDPVRWMEWRPADLALDEGRINDLVAARTAAKKARNFAEADRLRDQLGEMGVVLEDGPGGTVWRYAGR